MTYPPAYQFLPQQGEAVLLDDILDLRGQSLTARLKTDAAAASPLILIEAAAQAVAALQGARLFASGQKPRTGYLAGVRDFRWLHPAHASDPVLVEVREVKSLPPLFSFRAEIRQTGQLLADGSLMVYAGGE